MKNWRNSRKYRIWRAKVIRRDKRCIICGSIKHRHAHHLNHATYYLDQRYNPDNGVCLCKNCHTQFHTNFKNSFREKCTKKDFNNFKKLTEYLRSI